jgi:hypothetical protein
MIVIFMEECCLKPTLPTTAALDQCATMMKIGVFFPIHLQDDHALFNRSIVQETCTGYGFYLNDVGV